MNKSTGISEIKAKDDVQDKKHTLWGHAFNTGQKRRNFRHYAHGKEGICHWNIKHVINGSTNLAASGVNLNPVLSKSEAASQPWQGRKQQSSSGHCC